MKKEYFDLEIKLIVFLQDDIVRTSGEIGNDSNDVGGDDPYGDF